MQRGNNRRDVFDEPGDYDIFLRMIVAAIQRHGVDVHGFVLMMNHFHLLLTPRSETALPNAMKQMTARYCLYYNRKHARMGTIWNGRYKAVPIESDRQWLTCLRYIELNPVRAGVVTAPEMYPWSSFTTHAHGAPHDWLTGHPVLESLGRTEADRQIAYRALFVQGLTNSELTLQRHRIPVAAPLR